jgi:hypothetical protein
LAEELTLDEEQDEQNGHVTSTLVDDTIYDFDVTFPRGTYDLGLMLDENLTVAHLEDSKAAELTSYLRLGDLLVSVNGIPVEHSHQEEEEEDEEEEKEEAKETMPFMLVTRAAAQQALARLQQSGEWFWLRFRPARLETRGRRPLYDHNMTVVMDDVEGARLGKNV